MSSRKKIKIIQAITTVIILLLIIWDFGTPGIIQHITINPFDTNWSIANLDINSFIQTMLSALLGFLLSIWIIESVVNNAREKEASEKGALRLNVIFKLLSVPIQVYSKAAIAISNVTYLKHEGGYYLNTKNSVSIPMDKDALMDIYFPIPYLEEKLHYTKVEYYLNALDELQIIIKNILLNADLSNNLDLAKDLSDYLTDTYLDISKSKLLLSEKEIQMKQMESIGNVLNKPFDEIPENTIAFPFISLARLIERSDILFKKILSEEEYKQHFLNNSNACIITELTC